MRQDPSLRNSRRPSCVGKPRTQPINFLSGASGGLSILGWDSTTDPGYTKFKALIDAGKIRIDTIAATPGDYSRFLFSDESGQGVLKIDNSSLLAPAVVTDPVGQLKFVGQTATFTAQASGNPSPTLQWETSTDDGATWVPISGATLSTYTTPATAVWTNGDSAFFSAATNATGQSNVTLDGNVIVDNSGAGLEKPPDGARARRNGGVRHAGRRRRIPPVHRLPTLRRVVLLRAWERENPVRSSDIFLNEGNPPSPENRSKIFLLKRLVDGERVQIEPRSHGHWSNRKTKTHARQPARRKGLRGK